MSTSHARGFTLIELLVVIAIIGVLSAVVLASLNTARSKGNDAAVRSDVDNIRAQAQMYFNENSNYGTNAADESDCAAADNLFSDPVVIRQVSGANTANAAGSVTCNVAAGGTGYAVAAELVAVPGTYYCIDNTGMATTSATALGVATHC